MTPPTVLVTRAEADASLLVQGLEELGAQVLQAPAIRVRPPSRPETFADHLRAASSYDWILFTSAKGVEAAVEAGLVLAPPNRLAAVGPSTADACRKLGRVPDFVPSRYTTEALGRELPDVAGRRVLLLRAEVSNPELPQTLRERGARVDDVAAYRTVPDPTLKDRLRTWPTQSPDWVVLASPSAAEALDAVLPAGHPLRSNTKAACIGPVTASAARALGFRVVLEAQPHTVPALLRQLREVLQRG